MSEELSSFLLLFFPYSFLIFPHCQFSLWVLSPTNLLFSLTLFSCISLCFSFLFYQSCPLHTFTTLSLCIQKWCHIFSWFLEYHSLMFRAISLDQRASLKSCELPCNTLLQCNSYYNKYLISRYFNNLCFNYE